ncbi:MAG: GGDEF domain-containing protein, partial [Candidatus Latescibacteria bacterium]|nr:GGDEF domain-containing protein [Candidatus Latescibacterota bacterium]
AAPPPAAKAIPEPQAEDAEEPEPVEEEAAPEPALEAAPAEAPPASPSSVQGLQQKIQQLSEENKRWMRLAGISEVTGLPNRVMVSKVLLPGALKEAMTRHEPLGCILISPEGLAEINGKLGRAKGDVLLGKFSECLKAMLKRGERLSHLQGVDFAVLVPTMPFHQLRRRAEALHKELTSRGFDIDGEMISLKVSMGAAGFDALSKGNSSQALQEALYGRSIQALDVAKVKGNCIEIHEDHSPSH